MKLTRYKTWPVLALALRPASFAGAQSNDAPGPTEYPAFSRFITERNIFDPNRFPRNARNTARIFTADTVALGADVHAGRHDELRKGDVRLF